VARKNQASLHHSGRCTLPAPFYKGKGDISKIETSDTYAYLADALGSSRFVLRNGVHDVASVSYYALTYEPFGEAVASSGFDRLTFASEVRDSTGLVYLGARYYDPELGRFYALDPLIGSSANPQTLDRYVYCANSPLIHTDPRGMVFNLIAGAVGAVVGGVIGGVVAGVSGGDVLAGALGGAVGGAMAGVTCGASLLVAGAVSGGVTSFTTSMIETGGDLQKSTADAIVGGVIGGVTGGIGGAIVGKMATRSIVTSRLASHFDDAVKGVELSDDVIKAAQSTRGYNRVGTALHNYMEKQIGNDRVLKYSIQTPEKKGAVQIVRYPDAKIIKDNYWYDWTTNSPKQINNHMNRYADFGKGKLFLYDVRDIMSRYRK
jgi:RHS repeat-associated protein